MTVSRNALPRLFVAAGGIYTAQSLIGGLTFMGVPAVMRAQDASLDKIGLVSLAMLVWALKFLWAGPVERLRIGSGQRWSRIMILTGEGVVALLLVGFGLSGGVGFTTVLALLVLMAIVSATIDIACDAFVIEQFPAARRGLGNIAQVGGGYLGLIFGSGLFVFLYSKAGWIPASLALALLVLAMSAPMMLVREAPVDNANATVVPRLGEAFRRREIILGIGLAIVFELGGRLAQALSGPYLVDAGLSLTALGLLNGAGGVAAGLAGTFAGGMLVERAGAPKSMFVLACAHVITLGALAAAISSGTQTLALLATLFVVESALMAACFVASFSRLMNLSSPSQPGVDFSIFQCASAIVAALAGMSGAMIAQRLGYAPTFFLATAAAFIAVLIVPVIEKSIPEIRT